MDLVCRVLNEAFLLHFHQSLCEQELVHMESVLCHTSFCTSIKYVTSQYTFAMVRSDLNTSQVHRKDLHDWNTFHTINPGVSKKPSNDMSILLFNIRIVIFVIWS